jgi:hypothetical protein
MIWRAARHSATRRHQRYAGVVKLLLLAVALLLVACAPGTTRSPAPTATTASTRTTADALSHIHNASPDQFSLFASVTFTTDTTYDQAVAIMRGHVYPWTCDEPRSNTPPPLSVQRANFATWHGLLMSYPTWEELLRIASAPQAVSVEGTPLYPCP